MILLELTFFLWLFEVFSQRCSQVPEHRELSSLYILSECINNCPTPPRCPRVRRLRLCLDFFLFSYHFIYLSVIYLFIWKKARHAGIAVRNSNFMHKHIIRWISSDDFSFWVILAGSWFSNSFPHTSLWRFWSPNILSTTEEASHSWGETFGDQKRHRLVCGKLLEKTSDDCLCTKLRVANSKTSVSFSGGISFSLDILLLSTPTGEITLTSFIYICREINWKRDSVSLASRMTWDGGVK